MNTHTNTGRKRGRLFLFVLVFFALLAITLMFTTPLSRTKKTHLSDEKRFSPALGDEFDFEFLEEEEGDLAIVNAILGISSLSILSEVPGLFSCFRDQTMH